MYPGEQENYHIDSSFEIERNRKGPSDQQKPFVCEVCLVNKEDSQRVE